MDEIRKIRKRVERFKINDDWLPSRHEYIEDSSKLLTALESRDRRIAELEDELQEIKEAIQGPSMHPDKTGVTALDDVRDLVKRIKELEKYEVLCSQMTDNKTTVWERIKELEERVREYKWEWESACERDRAGQDRVKGLEERVAHFESIANFFKESRDHFKKHAEGKLELEKEVERLKSHDEIGNGLIDQATAEANKILLAKLKRAEDEFRKQVKYSDGIENQLIFHKTRLTEARAETAQYKSQWESAEDANIKLSEKYAEARAEIEKLKEAIQSTINNADILGTNLKGSMTLLRRVINGN